MGSRGDDVRGAVAQVCRDAARLLQEGQAARAYSGLVSASRSLPMTPRLAAVLVRCALKAGTERAVITLLDAAMVTERGEVRREVRRQLSRVLRRTGQEARAAAVLNGLLMDAPDDARARFVLDVLRERVAKAKPPAEDEESRTKTVEVSALALSDPELGNTVVEMPVVAAPSSPAWAPRAATVQVPLGEWAELGRTAAPRGPEFPWDDEGPGKARVVTPPQGAKTVPEPVSPEPEVEAGETREDTGAVPAPVVAPSSTVPEHVIAALSALMLSGPARTTEPVAASEVKAEQVEVPKPAAAPPLFEATQVFGKKLEDAPPADAAQASNETPAPAVVDESTSERILSRPAEPEAEAQAKASSEDAAASSKPAPRQPDAVLVPGAPAMAFDDQEATSEIVPPERSEAEKGAPASTPSSDGKPSAPRRASVLVPAASKPAFDEEESTSEVVFPQQDSTAQAAPKRDSTRVPSVKPSEPAAPDAPAPARPVDEGSERAQSQRQEAQLIARRAWRELAQLYLKRADRAKDAPERAEALTRLAEVMENELQDSAGAARMYREIVELTGERTALREQVRLLSQREDASLVRRALDDAIARARTSRARAVALLTRGERQLNMGNPAKAREDFEAADALVPGMLPVLAGLVRSVSDDERFAQVERLRAACAAAPRRAPDRLEALRVLAQTAEESLGDLRIAQWAWAEVLAESPDNDQPREHLLALARRLGDLPALSALLHAQLAREPRGPAARKAHLERVATLEAMGDAGAALAELRQAVRFEPGHKEAWLLLADRCTEREQFGEAAWALENAATATEDDEERQRTWERLALFCREVLHNTEKARLYARRAESLRKAREQRARPPQPEPARPASPQPAGVPPPSVLVAPPVATGRVPAAKSKDPSDEVTSNTDVPSLLQAEESSPEKRAPKAKDRPPANEALDAAPGNKKRGRTSRQEPGRGDEASKAPSGRHAAVGDSAQGAEARRRPASGKASVGSAVSFADTAPGAEVELPLKAPSGRHAPVDAARQPKSPSGRHAPVGATAVSTDAVREPKAPSGSHAPVGATDTTRQPKAPSGRHAPVASASPDAEPPRRSASTKVPAESPVSLADSDPAPGRMARAAKPARGGTAQDPGSTPEATPDRKPRAAATPPRERTTAFGAPLAPELEPEPPSASRKAAPEDNASARSSKNAGTQVREAPSRVERAPRAGHAPRAPLSASGVEPPAAAPRAMAGASRSVAPPSKGRGAPEAPPDIPLLSQIPSEDEDEDAQELGGGPVEATSVIAWEAPPGRMDPVRRIHRAGRPAGLYLIHISEPPRP
ncbi:hypothetical protein D7X55_31830, partial [Corallococcus sp. AB049A]|uniref:tetratricopeptide repeat protein n=1 Tax=Corallococcus sp. AB049A TaxID=2316721 RepID=UPI000EEF3742